MFDITDPIFQDADKAREYLEGQRWPDGPVCPHCGTIGDAGKLRGASTRPGVYKCRSCKKPFTLTVGTVFEDSKVPLNNWLMATFLMCSSKKGMSALQISRMLGVTRKTAWFMCHRIREAMTDGKPISGLGGENKVIEADETYVGGKAKTAHKSKPIPKKNAVVTLVERDGAVRAKHVANVTAKNIREHLVTNASRKSYLMSDESNAYISVGKEFSGHASVNHSADQYVRLGDFIHVNTAESFHAIIKRQMYGTHHAVSEQHLQRYINEIAFRWNNRIALGIGDKERTDAALKAIVGKRLTYRPAGEAAHA